MAKEDNLVILYVPCSSEEEAAKLATALLAERLIACGNIYRSRSMYRWEGTITDESEFVLFAKTTRALSAMATTRVKELHSYELPCVIAIEPDGVNEEYARWVAGEVSGHPAFTAATMGDS